MKLRLPVGRTHLLAATLKKLCVCVSGAGLLVPQGVVAEDLTWEMYLEVIQGGTR